uniref:Uncharacterized protein n=1 Tax=Parascaris univalens TaxID=6257 RepID=A0A914ZFD7_PARUN
SSSHVPSYPRDIHPYYLNPPHLPPGHPLCSGPPLGHPFLPPPFHQSMISLHHPNGADSGYMTSPADTERWKAHNWKIDQSRLSLNEAFLYETAPPPFVPMPPPNPKQLRKWQKKHKKLLKKMASMPPPVLTHAPPPVPPYTRAFSVDNLNSQVLDGYAELPAVNKKGWRGKKDQRKSHHFGESLPEVPTGPPRSTVSSCSNGFAVSELRGHTSAPSTNLSEHSRITSTNTDHSSSVIRTPSSANSKDSPRGIVKDAIGMQVSLAHPRSDSAVDRTLIETSEYQPYRSVATNTTSTTLNGHSNASQGSSGFMSVRASPATYPTATVIVHDRDVRLSNAPFTVSQVCNADNEKQTRRHCDNDHVENDGQTQPEENRSEKYNTTSTDDTFDSAVTERTIPIKITPEAKKILERNAQMFPRSESCEVERSSEVSRGERSESTLNSGSTTQSNTTSRYFSPPPTTPLAFQSLKRNAEYGSTVSSLTQSSNMKTEVSDIDFSWVNDVENRLEREIAFVKEDCPRHQMPVRYFGMDEEERQMSDSLQRAPSNRAPSMQPSEAFIDSAPRRELNEIHSDVRSKAAMFDDVAMRNSQSNNESQMQMGSRYRSRSAPRPEQNMFIPQPDYNSFEPISVDTSQNDTHRYFGFRTDNNAVNTTMSPSERRIRKYEHTNGAANMQQQTISAHDLQNARYGRNNVVPQRNVTDYRNEILQRNRTYDATEYYRQNAARRTDKPWRASVAY